MAMDLVDGVTKSTYICEKSANTRQRGMYIGSNMGLSDDKAVYQNWRFFDKEKPNEIDSEKRFG